MTCFRAVRYIVSILVVLSLGLFVAAGVLDYWWVVKYFGMETRQGKCEHKSSVVLPTQGSNKDYHILETFYGTGRNLMIILVHN